ncbi:hypothetical protein [Flavobacterium granuli]|uniref:Uncharacterized protein n=1 Tax=Flavobacterium granuli TaxID=280093 RepID=A0A1M5NIS2_9FLAO|nr:hypothetical protein [Flavobacterium granuli]PRZ23280.1 hypothetical protein BC624_1052 [Flavobacterium granuli]SHG88863.1 hypothetical protein SAMN05443373_1052 [Flavobacterium granuli]
MIELLSKHYQWLFSGIGVIAFTTIFNLFTKKTTESEKIKDSNIFNVSNSANPSIQVATNLTNNYYQTEKERKIDNLNVSDFDAIQIRKEIENGALFQKSQIAENYYGIRIKWEVSLQAVQQPVENSLYVMTFYKKTYPWVNFTIDMEKYPVFKVSKKGKKFIITGKIIKYESNTFIIDLEEILSI